MNGAKVIIDESYVKTNQKNVSEDIRENNDMVVGRELDTSSFDFYLQANKCMLS